MMSMLLDLASNLRETNEAIAQHERAIAAEPSPSLTASLRSLRKRKDRLEKELAALAANREVDVCPDSKNCQGILNKRTT